MAGTFKTRKIRIEYYQVVKACNGKNDELYDLREIIDRLDQLELAKRKKVYYQDEVRLDKIKYNEIDDYWYLNFVRLRQTGIPSKASVNKETEPIKLLDNEYIGEEVSAIYDVENHILVLQRNRDSLGPSGLEKYLNYFYNREEDESMIALRPIKSADLDEKLKNVKEYKKITMHFADIPARTIHGKQDSSFMQFIDSIKSYNANCATITMSLGRGRNTGSLEPDTITETISLIQENEGLVDTAELNIKTSELEPVETIDLFSKRSHDFISVKIERMETIVFDTVIEEMLKKYTKTKPQILKLL